MANVYLNTIEQNKILSDAAKGHISEWLTHDKYKNYIQELTDLIDDGQWQELEDCFFRVIPFGTGGRRGTVAAGSNRINYVTMGEVVQALCGYLTERPVTGVVGKKIAIAYDSRLTSVEFSEYAASICAANGFTACLYDDVRSTPQLSMTVRQIGAIAGIVISASHNPSSDNGIKIYWNDGGLLVPPYDSELLAYGEVVENIQTTDYVTAVADGNIIIIGEPEDDAYHAAVVAKSINTDQRSAIVAYSPLHGAGFSNVRPVLQKAGFDVRILESQANYDGNFTNVTNHIANPEAPAASDKVIAYGLSEGCDLAMTSDPDADRLGVVALHGDGTHTFLTGNQIAALLCDYILGSRNAEGTLNGSQFIAKTIVTTDLLDKIAACYEVTCRGNLLVGFKYIGELIRLHEDNGTEEFVFGGEESFGSLVGSYSRDKDAAGSALLMAELASQLKQQGLSLVDKLNDLYTQHGVFVEELDNISLKGANGFAVMKHIMNSLRADGVMNIAEFEVTQTRDYLPGQEIKGRSEDVLRFEVSEDGHDRVTVRPSGTEPKLKIYTQVRVAPTNSLDETKAVAAAKIARIRAAFNQHIESLMNV